MPIPFSIWAKTNSSFTPASLPNALFWLSAGTSSFSDAGITPSVNNASVAQQNDLSGGGVNFTATGAGKPVYKTAIQNGLPGLQFNPVAASFMDAAISNASAAFTIACVFKVSDVTLNGVLQGGLATAGHSLDINASRIRLLKQGVALIGSNSTNIVNNTVYTVLVTFDGTNYAFEVNGSADGSGANAQTFSATNTRLGTDETGSSAVFTGYMFELWKGSSVLSAGNKTSLTSYLRTKYAHY